MEPAQYHYGAFYLFKYFGNRRGYGSAARELALDDCTDNASVRSRLDVDAQLAMGKSSALQLQLFLGIDFSGGSQRESDDGLWYRHRRYGPAAVRFSANRSGNGVPRLYGRKFKLASRNDSKPHRKHHGHGILDSRKTHGAIRRQFSLWERRLF